MSNDDQIYATFPLHKVELKNKINLEPGTPVEVFRNNTTAVEVKVKEVPNRSKKKEPCSSYQDNKTSNIDQLKKELDMSKETAEVLKKGFNTVLYEMKRQLDELNQINFDIQMKNLYLQLENHKLKTLLESKTQFIGKLKKEFHNLKHSLKFVGKSLGCLSKIPDNISVVSDTEYEDFKNGLKKDVQVKCTVFDGTVSSARSKDRISDKH